MFSILSCSVPGFVHIRKAPRKPLEMYPENCSYLFESLLRRSVQTKDRLAVDLLQFREKSFNLLRRLHALRFCWQDFSIKHVQFFRSTPTASINFCLYLPLACVQGRANKRYPLIRSLDLLPF